MDEPQPAIDFDMQSAWLRRFKSDAESNMKAFALRLKEAMPDEAKLLETKPFFGAPKVTGISIAIGDHNYTLEVAGRQLKATIAMIVRGITLNTRNVDPAEWFQALAAQMQKTTEHAKKLSQSLSSFMTS